MHLDPHQFEAFGRNFEGAVANGALCLLNTRKVDGTPVALIAAMVPVPYLGPDGQMLPPKLVPLAEIIPPGGAGQYLAPTEEDNPHMRDEPAPVAPTSLILPVGVSAEGN